MLVKKALWIAFLAALTVFADVETAQAHWFEPQPHWWASGRHCAASRNPPARRWQALPPRSCASARMPEVALDAVSAASSPIVGKQEFVRGKKSGAEGYLPVVTRSHEYELAGAD